MEKKGIATEKGELNRNIQKANRLIREIRAQIGKLKEWIADLFKARETAPKQPPQSPNLANLLMKYLSVQREKSRKYSQRWQQQHTADELKTIAAAVNYLSEHGISNLDELDASLSSVSDKAYSIREGMKTAEQRMKELQKLMEYGRNYQTYKPIQDEYRQIRWKGKQEKFAEARRAELTLWDAANRYLHANLPEDVKDPAYLRVGERNIPTSKHSEIADYHHAESYPRRGCRASKNPQMRGYCTPRRPAGAGTDPHQAARTGAIKERTGKLLCLSVLNVF